MTDGHVNRLPSLRPRNGYLGYRLGWYLSKLHIKSCVRFKIPNQKMDQFHSGDLCVQAADASVLARRFAVQQTWAAVCFTNFEHGTTRFSDNIDQPPTMICSRFVSQSCPEIAWKVTHGKFFWREELECRACAARLSIFCASGLFCLAHFLCHYGCHRP